MSLMSPALAGGFFTTGTTCETQHLYTLKSLFKKLILMK